MKLDEITQLMERCGLPEKEARAFVNLTKLGECKVTDLAQAADLKRAETYQILERLQGRGLVEGTLARPRTFLAVPADRAVAILIEARTRELQDVEAIQDDLKQRLASLSGATGETSAGSFRILQEHNQIAGQLKRTIRAAKREICAVASSRGLFRLLLDEGLEEELKNAARASKLQLRILTEVLPGQEDTVERLLKFADVRHLMVPRPLRIFIADETELVQYVTADALAGGAKETALWFGASDHVQAQRAFFDDLWSEAVPAQARLDELRTGRPPAQARIVKGRFTRGEKAKEMLVRAKEEIIAYLPKDETSRLEKSGMRRALESRAKDGVAVKILVEDDDDLTLGHGVEVRRGADSSEVPTIVVDGQEALLVLTGENSSKVTALDEYGAWVTLPTPVKAFHSRLVTAWKRAKK